MEELSEQTSAQGQLPLLPPESYTAHRLSHATPEHLFLTTRRCFIGPIPEGWLKSHRRDWYKHHLRLGDSAKNSTFQARPGASSFRRLSGLEGPSSSALYGQNFPQPNNLEVEDDAQDQNEGEPRSKPTTASGSAVPIPRSSRVDKQSSSKPDDIDEDSSGALPQEGTSKASEIPDSSLKRPVRTPTRQSTKTSFVTASEGSSRDSSPEPSRLDPQPQTGAEARGELSVNGMDKSPESRVVSMISSTLGSESDGALVVPESHTSTSSLIPKDGLVLHENDPIPVDSTSPKGILSKPTSKKSAQTSAVHVNGNDDRKSRRSTVRGLVHFDVPEDSKRAELQLRARKAQMTLRHVPSSFRRRHLTDGRIIKMEKMLVRVDTTTQDLPREFDENESQRIESRVVEKWREYVVVCRESTSDEADYTLQMYKTRVIPEIEGAQVKKRSKHDIPLSRKMAKVNLFSTLDKSLVLWVPWRQGAMFYIMQTRSASNATEWYTFIRSILGWNRSTELQISVPDLNINLHIRNPFEELEISRDVVQTDQNADEIIKKTMEEEQAATGRLIGRCIEMLKKNPEWHDVLQKWLTEERIGLAWKRYDRLEWIYGANERKMYGTIGMIKSHELELRPKQHYPTATYDKSKKELIEPPGVEGFLVRLTSQRGADRRLGRLFFKRLYFSTHNQYLFFSRPAKSYPPPPPMLPMSDNSRVPTAQDIAKEIPLIYAVNPYPVKDGEIEWLAANYPGGRDEAIFRDQDAHDESIRKTRLLLDCDGYINLCNVKKVRKTVKGETIVDDNIEEGSDVDFDADVPDTLQDDGATRTFDDERTFELVLRNGLIVRLQAYDVATRKEWMKRLRDLVKYWKYRSLADSMEFQRTRQLNLDTMKITEEEESYIGQFARKWEVSSSHASPTLHHICGISSCRSIRMSGVLFRKPRQRATFTRCAVVLVEGKLLVFQDTLRSRTGKEIPHIQHEKISAIDLGDCFLYSGLLTENELLYRNRTFDANKPGHHGLPRIYRDDGWTSTDEDVMTCFVLWHGKRRSFFRSAGDGGFEAGDGGKRGGIRLVTKLGVPGNRVVFRTRSRAERDLWVAAIQVEMERLGRAEDVRITEPKGKATS